MAGEIDIVLSKAVKPSQLADAITEKTLSTFKIESVTINPKIRYIEVNLSSDSPNQIKISKKFPTAFPAKVEDLLDFIVDWIKSKAEAIQ